MSNSKGAIDMTRRPASRGRVASLAIWALAFGTAAAITGPQGALADTTLQFDAGQLEVTLDSSGRVTHLVSKLDNADYVSGDHLAHLIRLIADDAAQEPTNVTFDEPSSTFTFDFDAKDVQVDVQLDSKAGYATLEVTDIAAPTAVDVEALLWGPLTTNITTSVAETTGVVYNDEFAIGIHALNNKTIGGWPLELNTLGYPGGPGPDRMGYNMEAAVRTSWGSALQAYSWDYTQPRTRTVGIPGVDSEHMPQQPVPSMTGPDAELVGSKLALFGSWRHSILPTLEQIQLGEDLYHGTINGKWQKTAQETKQSFLVLQDISTSNVAQAAQFANQAGLKHIYSLVGAHGPFQSQGHFQFLNGLGGSDANVKTSIVDVAASYGVKYGAHTLSGFIDSHDAYVTPIPDPGLAKAGTATLTRALSSTAMELYVDSAQPFQHGHGTVIQVDNEMIEFSNPTQISASEWKLTAVTRHIWATAAASHNVGAAVSRIWVNQYGGAVAGHGLVDDTSARLAQAWNQSGTRSMSFDGLEALYLSEYGPYDLFSFMDNMLDNIQATDGFLTEASMMAHNQWDMQSRVSWGESNTSMGSRYQNMSYMRRNFLPPMIGWLYLNNYASVRALEQDLARMVAWNAGTGFQGSVSTLGTKGAYLDKIKLWESARNAGAFTAEQRSRLMDTSTYWTLSEVVAGSKWSLQETDANGTPRGAAEDVFVGNTAGLTNVALGQSVTFSGSTAQSPAFANDGLANNTNNWVGLNTAGTGWMQIDLGSKKTVSQIKLWQYFGNGRTYHDVVVQLSNDPNFSAAQTVTVFNNDADDSVGLGQGTDAEYAETASGRTIHVDDVRARYVRFWANGSTTNNYNSWVEAQVFESPRNLAAGISPTFSGSIAQSAAYATDGNTDSDAWVGLNAAGTGWMQLDLGATRQLTKVKLWQYWANGRTYHDVVIQVSNDPTFSSGVSTIFNNDADNSSGLGAGADAEYAETASGKTIPTSASGRYVRFWANGSSSNSYDSWVEAQVFGN